MAGNRCRRARPNCLNFPNSSARRCVNSGFKEPGRTALAANPASHSIDETRNRMFKRFKLSAKIVGTIVVVLSVTSLLSFWITQRRINLQAEESFRDKVRQIIGMAGATQAWFSANLDTLVPDRNYKDLRQVPVVAAW